MSARSEAIAVRVLIEERWVHVTLSRGASLAEISTLSAKPISQGGLGRHLAVPAVKRRARAYDARRRARLEDARENERQRRIAVAEDAVTDADRRLSAAAGSVDGYVAALRAYERAEERLAREQAGVHVPISRWMRVNVDIDVALEIAPHITGDGRDALRRSLDL